MRQTVINLERVDAIVIWSSLEIRSAWSSAVTNHTAHLPYIKSNLVVRSVLLFLWFFITYQSNRLKSMWLHKATNYTKIFLLFTLLYPWNTPGACIWIRIFWTRHFSNVGWSEQQQTKVMQKLSFDVVNHVRLLAWSSAENFAGSIFPILSHFLRYF